MLFSLPDFFPAAFLTLVLAHFVALISPGADFFLIVGHSVRHGLKGSVFICVGIALANAVYILLAIVGWSTLKHYPTLFVLIECLGAAYLMWLGYLLIKNSRSNKVDFDATSILKPLSAFKQLMTGFLSGILNPKNFIFYMSLMTGILGNQVTLVQQIVSGLWLFFAVLFYDLFVAYLLGHPKSTQYFMNKIGMIEKGSGCVLVLIAIGIIVGLVR